VEASTAKPSLTERVVRLAQTPYALWAMAAVAVIDGSIFPIPPFALLVPMVLAHPKRALRYATVGTVASLFGGLLGWGLGRLIAGGLTHAFSVDPNLPLHFHFMGHVADTTLAQVLTQNFWLLAIACSILPTPYKIVAIGSGVVGVALPQFMLASIIGRCVRFFAVTYALVFFGKRAERFLSPKAAAAVFVLWLLQPHTAWAHIPPGSFIIAKVADKRAAINVGEIDLSLQTEKANGEQGDERLYLKRGGKLRWVHDDETVTVEHGDRRAEIAAGGQATSETILVEPLVDFLLPRAMNAEGIKSELIALCQHLGIDLSVSSLARLGTRVAYVLGAKPGEKDRPQIWIDKEWFAPIRVIYKDTYHGKSGVWDVQWREFNSREAGEVMPRLIERRFDGQLVSRSEVQKATPNARLSESLFALPR
jgi:membrane protein YqaA with SNARE-associated domain/outer membrane lipoprotein-sorting protein